MYYVVESKKSFERAAEDLETSVKKWGFGVLHIHDLGETLRKKGQAFSENCRIFEVCNPAHAARVLGVDMKLNMALPCRISVFTERGVTKIGLIRPLKILKNLSDDPRLTGEGGEVEEKIIRMVDDAV